MTAGCADDSVARRTSPITTTRVYAAGYHGTAMKSIRIARDVADRLVARVNLPHGARPVAGDQSVGGALSRRPFHAAASPLVEATRFWRVPGRPCTVIAWLDKHPLARSKLIGSFEPVPGACKRGTRLPPASVTTPAWGSMFELPQARFPVDALVVVVAAAKEGGSALRVDAQVAPPGATVPSSSSS